MLFSSDVHIDVAERPHTDAPLVDLQIYFTVRHPDDYINVSRIVLHVYRNKDSPFDVDLSDIYSPGCPLRKHGIRASNLMLESTWKYVGDESPEDGGRCAVLERRIAEIFDKIDAMLTLAESRASAT
jgi:hypothetical protein